MHISCKVKETFYLFSIEISQSKNLEVEVYSLIEGSQDGWGWNQVGEVECKAERKFKKENEIRLWGKRDY